MAGVGPLLKKNCHGKHDIGIAFGGGGMMATAFVGAMQALCETSGVCGEHVVGFAGASAGALFAMLAALKWSSKQMEELVLETQFGSLVDRPNLVVTAWRVVTKYGISDHAKLSAWIGEIIGRELGSPNATFAELRAKTGKDLHVTATNTVTRQGEVFGTVTSPNRCIRDCVLASMSLPPVFQPFRFERGGMPYADGGISNNLPEDIVQSYSSNKRVRRVISFKLQSDRHGPSIPRNVLEYGLAVIYSSLNATANAQGELMDEEAEDDKLKVCRYVLNTGILKTEDWNAPKNLLLKVIQDAKDQVESQPPFCFQKKNASKLK